MVTEATRKPGQHAMITALLANGWTLREVQEFVDHSDPRTTEGYDHNRLRLDQSPAYELGRMWAGAMHDENPDESHDEPNEDAGVPTT